jgi:murein tripeptide amidase MpaA
VYLNAAQIESALAGLRNAYPSLCELIALPEPTFEGRKYHAVRIRKTLPGQVGVLFMAGVHAREIGGPEAAINFCADLLEAYSGGKGVRYVNTVFTAQAVKNIVETLSVVVLPCANPDGYNYRRTSPAPDAEKWRKNRNPASSGDVPSRIGVDINRNHDFLWDFRKHFHPNTSPASDNPADDTYHGTAPASEPETRNIRWLLDTYPEIGYALDIHSVNGSVLYSWGHDENQTVNSAMSFLNASNDGQRGRPYDGYSEFIPEIDEDAARGIAVGMAHAANGVRAFGYHAVQSFWLDTGDQQPFPTSGAVDDYCYSRHFRNLGRKVFGFTLEFGNNQDGGFNATWAQAVPRILEVSAAMMALCRRAAERPRVEPQIWDLFIALIGGVEEGGPGIGILPGGGRVPIPPRGPLLRELVPMLAALEALQHVNANAVSRVQRELLKAIAKAANDAANRS